MTQRSSLGSLLTMLGGWLIPIASLAGDLPRLVAVDPVLGHAVLAYGDRLWTARRHSFFGPDELLLVRVTSASVEVSNAATPRRNWVLYLDGRPPIELADSPPSGPPILEQDIQRVSPRAQAEDGE